MKSERSFPPGIGWVPIVIAIAALAVVSAVTVVPQYTKTTNVGTVAGSSGGPVADSGGGGTDASAGGGTQGGASAGGSAHAGSGGSYVGGTAGTKGSAGRTVTSGGSAGSGGAAGGGGAALAPQAGLGCDSAHNGGNTAPGVSATEIHVASTIVTTGVGAGFLGEAVYGMQGAINEVNSSGGICGRRIVLDTINSGWDYNAGGQDISNYINSGNVFSLVGEPDSQGLANAIDNGTIDRSGIPVVGTDGMLADQYKSQWVFPVAASTVTNMHIIAKYAYDHGARKFGIVFDTSYKFGPEGAAAFAAEVQRLGGSLPGAGSQGCSQAYCGISSSNTGSFSQDINTFNNACGQSGSPCDAVVMLLEPQPMETWMKGEENAPNAWYKTLYGGEPLFDDNFASTCGGDCAKLTVWTGYHPSLQPFDSEAPVHQYVDSLKSAQPSADPHNEFTEGAYLGTKMFIAACQKLGGANIPLTRDNLRQELSTTTFDLGLSAPLSYASLPHLANTSMAAFADNAQGSFNGWNYLATGFIDDPARGQDLSGS